MQQPMADILRSPQLAELPRHSHMPVLGRQLQRSALAQHHLHQGTYVYMEFTWNVYGMYMECIWNVYGIYMESGWRYVYLPL